MSVLRDGAAVKARILFAHGAGAPMDSSFMEEVVGLVADSNIEVIRFEFPYMMEKRETGKKRPPDRVEKLIAYFKEQIDEFDDSIPLYLMGKSMGGRIASLILDETDVRGAFALGYPFHPIGKPEKLRVEHLKELSKPIVIFQGTRDPMGSKDEVEQYVLSDQVELVWFEDANHDLKPRVKSGFTQQEYLKQVANRISELILNDQ